MSATLPGPGFQSVQQRGQENQDQAVGPSGIIPSDPKLIPETRDYASSFTFQHLSRRSWNEAGNAKIRPGKSSRWMKVGQDLPPPLTPLPPSETALFPSRGLKRERRVKTGFRCCCQRFSPSELKVAQTKKKNECFVSDTPEGSLCL